ncbi:hypothetical protein [Gordonia otitidis]|uniref:Uncharacterized protein n=1 Tax=Gordonia otitidis (strain DSM 44809 / CCUG 52243 / JCM 12355 / NBRC 100426 / IFM 10032) TaxID=1108044 RepID=H5TSM2_GORO1|nr:hypothetical protein [Gordonia otitidis]GAB36480.1 hypothetical protein GOOTI_221_00230 [Gordonia otitidis NBRC 100426]
MTATIDPEELYYQMVADAEERGLIVDDDADEQLAEAARAQAAAHNKHVCTACNRARPHEQLHDRTCRACRAAEIHAETAYNLRDVEEQIAQLEARRDELLRRLD